MPYKHIAARLRKTELACRLHYHQLSNASNRRKRTTSMSPDSSTGGCSPEIPASLPPLISEQVQHLQHHTPSPSPPGSSGSRGYPYNDTHIRSHVHSHGYAITRQNSQNYSHSPSNDILLPKINTDVTDATTSVHNGTSPRLPAILPMPVSMPLTLNGSNSTRTFGSASHVHESYLAPLHSGGHISPPAFLSSTPTSSTATRSTVPNSGTVPHSLCLDYGGQSPLPLPAETHQPVDMVRLQSVYASLRAPFWAAIASEYGHGSDPAVLEQAWQMGGVLPPPGLSTTITSNVTTPTRSMTPDTATKVYSAKASQQSLGTSMSAASDKTRISSILGIDANPRGPEEREMVRRLEEERFVATSVSC
ncbi:hypothetical protein SEPCBS57363_002097 [Sporothrix epigloea]|uniref:Uncharacterized protein n=1 Tax=Sporothrix epigloea TaxID=1892477 RepID=A0ABP0DFN0_9PEZI